MKSLFLLVVAGLLLVSAVGVSASASPQGVVVPEAGKTCSFEGCVQEYYWWWVVSGKPASEFTRDYWFPCRMRCANGD